MSSPDEEKLSSQSMQFPNESYFSPIKKRKINSQQSLRIANETVNTVEGSTMKFETPVVKRVSESTRILTNDEFIIHTPPSILKVTFLFYITIYRSLHSFRVENLQLYHLIPYQSWKKKT